MKEDGAAPPAFPVTNELQLVEACAVGFEQSLGNVYSWMNGELHPGGGFANEHARAVASAVLRAVPDGWCKRDGRWVRA